MTNRKFVKTYAGLIAPAPEIDALWMDLTTDPNGSVIKYWNGTAWVNINSSISDPIFTGDVTFPVSSSSGHANNKQLEFIANWIHPTIGFGEYVDNLTAYTALGAGMLYMNTTNNTVMQSIYEF